MLRRVITSAEIMKVKPAVHAPGNSRAHGASEPRILQLDGLRGIAVLSVVFFHYVLSIPLPLSSLEGRLQSCFRVGGYGVDLFFVLSGFLIGGILLDSKESPRYFRTFYLRRFHRILPLYYLWLAFFVVLSLSAFPYLPASIRCNWSGLRPVEIYVLFLQNLVPKQLLGISASWLGPLWSLAVEEQFYLLMPIAVRFLSRRRLVQLLMATIVASPLLRAIAMHWSMQHAAAYVATPMRADALALGVLLAVSFKTPLCVDAIRANLGWLYATVAGSSAGVLYLAARPSEMQSPWEGVWSFSVMALFFAAIVLLSLARPEGVWANFCKLPALRKIGKISYCVYVIHLAVLVIYQAWFDSLSGARSIGLSIAAAVFAAISTWALAKVSWHYLESRMIRRGHSYSY